MVIFCMLQWKISMLILTKLFTEVYQHFNDPLQLNTMLHVIRIAVLGYMARISAGSIPDSYDIYRYLNLVRYSILDTFVVNVISSTYSGATLNDCAMSIYYFSKNCFVMKHYGENEIPIFLSKIRFFSRKSDISIFVLANPHFSLENPIFFFSKIQFFSKNIQNSEGCPLLYTTFRKHRNPVFGHFPSFPASSFMPRVINIPSISDTLWCTPGFILCTP